VAVFDLGSGECILVIADAGTSASAGFHKHVVAVCTKFLYARGRDGAAEIVVLVSLWTQMIMIHAF
jgi:hypothetical protein